MSGPDRTDEPEWPIRRDLRAERDDRGPRGSDYTDGDTRRSDRSGRDTGRSDYAGRDTTQVRSRKRGINPLLLALLGLVLLLVLAWLFTGNRDPDQDKLTGTSSEQARAADPEKRCASKATYDFIKRDLFRRAAQVRGSDQAAFDRLSAYAVLRMENPVMETENQDEGTVGCSGNLSLDLPPGVGVVGGRRTLSADVEYTVRQAADGSGTVVLLRNADSIITPLATLARTGQQQQQQQQQQPAPGAQPMAEPNTGDLTVPRAPNVAPPPAPQPPPRPAPIEQPRATTSARPSFNCANARTRGEIAVCSDSGLASLDRQMASQFSQAMSGASPGQRAMLQRTRGRFLSYRDSCGSDSCIADAYRGRMREISDIMSGSWQQR